MMFKGVNGWLWGGGCINLAEGSHAACEHRTNTDLIVAVLRWTVRQLEALWQCWIAHLFIFFYLLSLHLMWPSRQELSRYYSQRRVWQGGNPSEAYWRGSPASPSIRILIKGPTNGLHSVTKNTMPLIICRCPLRSTKTWTQGIVVVPQVPTMWMNTEMVLERQIGSEWRDVLGASVVH